MKFASYTTGIYLLILHKTSQLSNVVHVVLL